MKNYKIAVAGTGYVGLSLAVLLSQKNEVTAVDIVPEKVEKLNKRISPIQDKEIEEYLATKDLNLRATTDGVNAYKDAEFVIIAAPTNYDPQKNFFDTSAVESVIELVMASSDTATMVIKSTIPVGYTDSVRKKYGTDATFVSLLIRKDAVLRCGLPCKDYFIWGDDGEYTLRLTHFYGPAYMVGKSIAIHKRMGAKKLDLSNFQDENRIKMYHYYVRNNIVNQLYYKKDRNRAITIIKKLAQAVCSVKYLGQKNGAIKARTVWKGTIEGFSQFNTFKTYIDAQISKK